MAIPQKLLDGLGRLEPMPLTAQRLAEALRDPDISSAEVAGIVEHDQAVATTVLRQSNSALFAARYKIESIRDAVVRLGTASLLGLVLEGHVRKLDGAAPIWALRENELWLHGAIASHAASELLAARPKLGIPRTAPIAALLHDVGKLVMSRFMKADARQLLEVSRQRQVGFVEAEREVLGCDHAEVGAALARAWSFPDEIVAGIELHHRTTPGGAGLAVDAVMLANLVAKTVGTGLGAEGMGFDYDPGIRERLGIDHPAFCRLCAATSVRLAELRQEHALKV